MALIMREDLDLWVDCHSSREVGEIPEEILSMEGLMVVS
jgi:hypothetical protein